MKGYNEPYAIIRDHFGLTLRLQVDPQSENASKTLSDEAERGLNDFYVLT